MDREERERLRALCIAAKTDSGAAIRYERDADSNQMLALLDALDACERERDLAANRLGWKKGEVVEDRITQLERERDEARIAVEQTYAVNRALKGTNERLAAEYEAMEEDARALAQAIEAVVDPLEGYAEGLLWRTWQNRLVEVLRRPGVRHLLSPAESS